MIQNENLYLSIYIKLVNMNSLSNQHQGKIQENNKHVTDKKLDTLYKKLKDLQNTYDKYFNEYQKNKIIKESKKQKPAIYELEGNYYYLTSYGFIKPYEKSDSKNDFVNRHESCKSLPIHNVNTYDEINGTMSKNMTITTPCGYEGKNVAVLVNKEVQKIGFVNEHGILREYVDFNKHKGKCPTDMVFISNSVWETIEKGNTIKGNENCYLDDNDKSQEKMKNIQKQIKTVNDSIYQHLVMNIKSSKYNEDNNNIHGRIKQITSLHEETKKMNHNLPHHMALYDDVKTSIQYYGFRYGMYGVGIISLLICIYFLYRGVKKSVTIKSNNKDVVINNIKKKNSQNNNSNNNSWFNNNNNNNKNSQNNNSNNNSWFNNKNNNNKNSNNNNSNNNNNNNI
jgi:hypothetical protein